MRHVACFLAGILALAGCGGGEGTVAFSSWGEDYIEKEIPEAEFEDGWSVRYSKFLVVIGNVKIADDEGTVGAEMKGSKLVNHVTPGVKPIISFPNLEAKAWTKVSYEILPADGSTELGEGATAADLDMMKAGGYAVYVEGTATKGATSKSYKWGFTVPTAYNDCKGDKDGKETFGVLVTNGGTDEVELTIHGDHLYYDDLQAANAKLRFNAIASADADMDGVITLEELAAVKLVDIDPADGAYGTGAAGNVNDLRAFVTDLSRTVGHFRGEGECFGGDPK
jgi:hypothetical protein